MFPRLRNDGSDGHKFLKQSAPASCHVLVSRPAETILRTRFLASFVKDQGGSRAKCNSDAEVVGNVQIEL